MSSEEKDRPASTGGKGMSTSLCFFLCLMLPSTPYLKVAGRATATLQAAKQAAQSTMFQQRWQQSAPDLTCTCRQGESWHCCCHPGWLSLLACSLLTAWHMGCHSEDCHSICRTDVVVHRQATIICTVMLYHSALLIEVIATCPADTLEVTDTEAALPAVSTVARNPDSTTLWLDVSTSDFCADNSVQAS